MAPSNMFSRLRPGHAKRTASSTLPSSDPVAVAVPVPVITHSHAHPQSHAHSQPHGHTHPALQPSLSTEYFSSPRHLAPDTASYASISPVSPLPPQLPPIPRVASKMERRDDDEKKDRGRGWGKIRDRSRSRSRSRAKEKEKEKEREKPSLAHVVEQVIQEKSSKSKSRLTLRNPMSLLMRRRSAQNLVPLADESLVTIRSPPMPPVPDNYDPSIRGRIVHDFSAPRVSRNFSYNNAYTEEQPKSAPSPPRIEREHTPVFREHFDDDTSYEQSQANIRAEQLANKDFIKRNSYVPPAPAPERSPPAPPPKNSPSPPLTYYTPTPPPPPPEQTAEFEASVLSPVQEAPSPSTPSAGTPRKKKSTKTPPTSRSRATSLGESFVPAGLPAHFTSRASRFSFQMGGGDSAEQEKILEDRHKEKEAEKASKQVRMSAQSVEDDYDDYGMDDYDDMDGGYEEDIPMLGEEDEYAGLGDQSMSPGIAAFDFSSLSMQPNINTMSPISIVDSSDTPRDQNGIPIGNAIGFAVSENTHKMQPAAVHGLGLSNVQGPVDPTAFTPAETPEETNVTARKELALDAALDDDLYFDDGMIDELGEGDAEAFDEDQFDDPDGPLFDRRVKPAPVEEALAMHPIDGLSSEAGYDADDDTLSKHAEKSAPTLAHSTSRAQPKPAPDLNNLEAYHSALAEAANRAEADGRFTRKASVDIGPALSDADDSSSISNSRPSLVPDDGRYSLDTTSFPVDDDGFGMDTSFMDDYDYSEYDSALENDPMIAEANAEALANDHDGFYGQEFGFYAAAQGEAVNSYGGFFGPSGLGRTVSGRNAVREPNLTPITERSEYSTRNSFISIRGSQQLTSPGLAQLARMSPYGWPADGEDMSLDSLLKLRKGAFGSSSSAPVSQPGSPRNSSPMGMQFVPRAMTPAGNRMQEQDSDESAAVTDSFDDSEGGDDAELTAAVNGDMSDGEDYQNGADSPTLTASDNYSFSSAMTHLQPSPIIPEMPLHSPPGIPNQYPFHMPFSPAFMSPLHQQTMTLPSPLQSPTKIPLPMSPPPLTVHTGYHPPSSVQSPSTGTAPSTSTARDRRQSLGLISPVSTTSPVTPGGGGWQHHATSSHSRKGSASTMDRDSVAYVREQDEEGTERWVLERRRTAESGELELVGRSVVEGGRI